LFAASIGIEIFIIMRMVVSVVVGAPSDPAPF
jgi:hypothetical protein